MNSAMSRNTLQIPGDNFQNNEGLITFSLNNKSKNPM